MITEVQYTGINKKQLVSLYQIMLENADMKSAEKMLQISKKWMNQEFMVSFIGHFSAGKSSMINHLLERLILPKSPIPTSANVVKITSGEGRAQVYTDEGTVLEYEEPYDIDMIKDYAMEKGTIKEIEISTKEAILPENCTIIDTPGIDAADDADRLITESSMHLVDALFYVMDYNHVQSEVNLEFLKKVQKHHIPFFIIINQIDKHNENELPFDEFCRKINQTFEQWGIMPEKVYYSSLFDKESPNNQIDAIKNELFQLLTNERDNFLNVERSVEQVVDEHKRHLQQEYESEVSESDPGEGDSVYRLEELNLKINRLNNLSEDLEKDVRHEVNTTLKNAYLMPATLRDLAHAYLQSQQQDFKVGLFGSNKKTAEARRKREADFLAGLQETIETSVQWRLRDKLLNLLQSYGLHDQEITHQVQNMSITYDTANLRSLIKPGATVNGDYVLHYTDDISNDIKQKYKQEALKLLDSAKELITDKTSNELAELESERADVENTQKQRETTEMLKRDLDEKLREVDTSFTNPKINDDDWQELEKAMAFTNEIIKMDDLTTDKKTTAPAIEEFQTDQHPPESGYNYQADRVLSDLEDVTETVKELPGFGSIIADLQHKHNRLKSRKFTVALFGAFSAGKSSLANALIGEHILPSAPNPTTAVINRINPVNEDYKHGTVIVKMKDEATLISDLKSLLHQFEPETDSIDELLAWIVKHNIHQNDQLHTTQQAYLKALLEGYKNREKEIGDEIAIGLDEFASFVTDETIASFIESVDLYYDCKLTRDGITLVDTPGADSINARHTDVAFDYIKYADAILYVTYYNHAFSRADKDFLMQLGRVKDSFQLDKMFFVMNASDLAEDTSEREMVQRYIKEQLTSLGIHFPRLFPVSSKRSLEEKQENSHLNGQMKAFEYAFENFIRNELASLTIDSAIRDISRAKLSITHFLESLQMDEEEKKRARRDLITKRTSLKMVINDINSDLYEQQITQKLEKQLYFVLERFSIRFNDMFKETFNPGTITESGRKASQQLKNNLRKLLDYAGYELLQELRAVSLRIESFVNEMKHDIYLDYTSKSKDIDEGFLLPHFEATDLVTPDYEQAFFDLSVQTFDKELKGFNGPKAFFAKNEKETMKENIFNLLYPFANDYINESHTKMQTSYSQQWQIIIGNIKDFIDEHVDSYIDNQLQIMDDQTIDLETLRKSEGKLTSILANYEEMS
ncbi:GTPase Era, involved in 16S rRNA processing [Lentibacillus persicus]|uniref:GTPase Era, involved in 16S rRNA processing n=1 Tax=Lentibacillus persicus TaxID=640948 RepID=A0A1I1V451_9BACI|nr:dynamin family protein [Lentibacillus persicus]SFD77812.1 GTPase Era, involved in 16S rRNA processing [Lentibacillus persicus]